MSSARLASFLLLTTGSAATASTLRVVTATFGPEACITAGRSSSGTCVLSTNCSGHDLSTFDFAFDCVSSGNHVTRHSLGVGSFDEVDEFDSEVHCDACLAPGRGTGPAAAAARATGAPATAHLPPPNKLLLRQPLPAAAVATVAKAVAPAAVAATPARTRPRLRLSALQVSAADSEGKPRHTRLLVPPAKGVQRYGPGMCVSVWRDNATEHCVMRTSCILGEDISQYEFGLLCVQGSSKTRHLFGAGSFDRTESFDTLIRCEACEALDDRPLDAGVAVAVLRKEVSSLKKELFVVTAAINKISTHLYGHGHPSARGLELPVSGDLSGFAPAAAPAAAHQAAYQGQLESGGTREPPSGDPVAGLRPTLPPVGPPPHGAPLAAQEEGAPPSPVAPPFAPAAATPMAPAPAVAAPLQFVAPMQPAKALLSHARRHRQHQRVTPVARPPPAAPAAPRANPAAAAALAAAGPPPGEEAASEEVPQDDEASLSPARRPRQRPPATLVVARPAAPPPAAASQAADDEAAEEDDEEDREEVQAPGPPLVAAASPPQAPPLVAAAALEDEADEQAGDSDQQQQQQDDPQQDSQGEQQMVQDPRPMEMTPVVDAEEVSQRGEDEREAAAQQAQEQQAAQPLETGEVPGPPEEEPQDASLQPGAAEVDDEDMGN